MRPEDIEKLLKTQPFVPFRVHLSNGHTFDVKHPETVFLWRTHMEHGTPVREGSIVMDHKELYAYIHIARIEILENKQSPAA